jgi:hypothetical protein
MKQLGVIIHRVRAKNPNAPKLFEVSRLDSPPILGESRSRGQKERFGRRIILELPIEPGYGGFPVFPPVSIEIGPHVPSIDSSYQGRDIRR